MTTRSQNAILGLTTIGMVVLFLGTIYFLAPAMRFATRDLEVHFRHDEGLAPLKVGSPVILSGALEVGKVTGLRTEQRIDAQTPTAPPKLFIIVDAAIDRDLILYQDCLITTDQPAVGGGGSLVILSVGTPPTLLDPRKPLVGLPSQSFAATISTLSRRLLGPDGMLAQLERALDERVAGSLMSQMHAILSDINGITTELRAQTDPGTPGTLLAKVQRSLDDVNGLTGALRQQTDAADAASLVAKVHASLDSLAAALGDVATLLRDNRPKMDDTLTHVQAAARVISDQVVPAAARQLAPDDDQNLVGKLHTALDRVNHSLGDVNTSTDELRALVVQNRPMLQRTLDNLKDTSDQLRLTGQELRLAPWKLLYQPTAQENQQQRVFEATRTFADAATTLNDALVRLEALEARRGAEPRSAADDEELTALRTTIRAAFERFRQAEQFLYDQMK